MTATLNVVVSINSTTVMQTFGTAVATFRVPLTLIPALRSRTPPAPCTSSNAWQKKSTERTEIHRLAHIFFCVNPCPICSYSPIRIHLQINSLCAPLESKITYIFSSMNYKSFLILQKNL